MMQLVPALLTSLDGKPFDVPEKVFIMELDMKEEKYLIRRSNEELQCLKMSRCGLRIPIQEQSSIAVPPGGKILRMH